MMFLHNHELLLELVFLAEANAPNPKAYSPPPRTHKKKQKTKRPFRTMK